MRRVFITSIIVLVAACASGESQQEPPKAGCEMYREHMLDVRVAHLTAHRDKHRAALKRSLGDDFVADCERRLTQADLDCAMAAKTTEQLRACSQDR